MTDMVTTGGRFAAITQRPPRPDAEVAAHVRRRYARERRFKAIGMGAVMVAIGLLAILLTTVLSQGLGAFQTTYAALDVTFDAAEIDPSGSRDPEQLADADYQAVLNQALYATFPEVTDRLGRRALRGLLASSSAIELRSMVLDDPSIIGTTQKVRFLLDDERDQYVKGEVDPSIPEANRRLKDRDIALVDQLTEQGRIETGFNWVLFSNADSREPEQAGLRAALVGSAWMMLICFCFAVPIGVAAAVYLEEFAPKSRWIDLIEVNVNNLAAVPSIVFGLLGLAIFLNLFGIPRSASLAGGLTLALMTLPVIIVVTRAALRAVPPSIRAAALGVGASPLQVVTHHVLPLALPGILTGTIIGMARALGETAPLLMIGMVAFIANVPSGPMDPATALPVQIYLWSDSPERAFTERMAAAIIVLLGFLIVMNLIAVLLRKKFERTW
ncbi:phosphate ABC transporter permease PstA [Geminicoccus roseus]|uniref:phosphate ABC transporter permease PstA n=1 Tax=Geminicoccus roseus TaxID=404900 RepID=UPI000A0134F6|nr:phosphate ABC transporter permease PstA [Geminicoccus roseus]